MLLITELTELLINIFHSYGDITHKCLQLLQFQRETSHVSCMVTSEIGFKTAFALIFQKKTKKQSTGFCIYSRGGEMSLVKLDYSGDLFNECQGSKFSSLVFATD